MRSEKQKYVKVNNIIIQYNPMLFGRFQTAPQTRGPLFSCAQLRTDMVCVGEMPRHKTDLNSNPPGKKCHL